MKIEPKYGLFISLESETLRNFAETNISAPRHLNLEMMQKMADAAKTNLRQFVLRPLHNDNNPFYIGSEGSVKYRLRAWNHPIDNENPAKMVLIIESERDVDGDAAIVVHRAMVGSEAPVLMTLKSTCCRTAPMSAVTCLPQQGRLMASLRDPIADISAARPALFADGIHIIDKSEHDMIYNLALSVSDHSDGLAVPAVSYQSVRLGGNSILSNGPS